MSKPKPHQYRLSVKFGDDVLDEGWTGVPNILRNHYRDLGLKDQEFAWIIHLLVHQWTREAPRPRQQHLPMSASIETRRRYCRNLRNLGLLFSTRRYYTAETAPEPELAGKLETLEYHLESLWHNLVRVARWKREGKPLEQFTIEVPEAVLEKIVKGEYHDVPQKWIDHANRHVGDIIGRYRAGEYISEDQRWALLCQNAIVEGSTMAKASTRKASTRKASTSFCHRQQEDSVFKEDPMLQEEDQQQQEDPGAAAVVLHLDDLAVGSTAKDFTLADDEVLVLADSDGSGGNQGKLFTVQPLSEVVQRDIRALGRYDRYLMASTRRKVYYSVEHAMGEGGDEWTEEELGKIGERERLERELGERYNRLGAFSLEEALHRYFSPQFTARILEGSSPAERERIAGWVAYTRRAEGLKSPSGFLRSRIESDEQPPQT